MLERWRFQGEDGGAGVCLAASRGAARCGVSPGGRGGRSLLLTVALALVCVVIAAQQPVVANRPIYEPLNDLSMSGAGARYASGSTPLLLFVEDRAAPGWYFVYQRPGGP